MFCLNCGNAVDENTRFCASCGAAQRREDSVPPPASAVPVSSRPTAPRKSLKDRIMDSLLIPVGVILLLMGVGYMTLSVVGKTTTAQVTGYEQMLILNDDDSTRNPSRYRLEYELTVNGKRYDGSVTRIFENGSHMRTTIQVRYFPFWPHVNAEDRDVNPVGPVTLGVGVLTLAVGVRKKRRNKNRKVVG